MKMPSVKAIVIVVVGCGVVFGAVFGFILFRNAKMAEYFATHKPPPTAVSAAKAEEEDWTLTLSAIGTLQAQNGVDVSPEVAGAVREIRFESGQTVKQGDVLVNLDTEQEKADLRSQQAEQSYAMVTASRYRVLSAGDVVSQSTRDRAEADLNVNNAKIASINAEIQKKIITAPFDGVLGVRKVDVGQYLQAGTTIVNLQNLAIMYCDFTLPQKDIANIKVGQRLVLSVDAYSGKTFEGTIEAIEPRIDATSGMVAVRGRFDNREHLLRPGMFATVEVVLPDAAKVVVIPQQAISYSLSGDTVFVIRKAGEMMDKEKQQKNENDQKGQQTGTDQKDSKDEESETAEISETTDRDALAVERANIKVGMQDGERVAVEGLKAGDQVVTAGQLKLRNGALVEIVPDNPQKKPDPVPLN